MPHGTARTDSRAAIFATSRRGGPDHYEIIRLHALGRGVQTIANITGSSMEDVARVLSPDPGAKNDNAPKPDDARAARDAQFRRMWRAGVNRKAMAETFGMDISSVDRMRARLGLRTRQRIHRPVQKSGK